MKQSRILVLGAAIAIALAACKGQDEAPVDTAATPDSTTPVAEAPVAAPKPDLLKADQISIVLAADGESRIDDAKGTIEIPVKVTNNGPVALSGTSNPPVNIGVQILGDDGTTAAAGGGVRDFTRSPLPVIEPGATASVLVTVPADARANGRKLRLDLVQEGHVWFSKHGQPTLDAGPFDIKAKPRPAAAEPATDPNMRSL